MEEIKACPFCGKEPTEYVTEGVVQCVNVGCPIGYVSIGKESWNTRVPDTEALHRHRLRRGLQDTDGGEMIERIGGTSPLLKLNVVDRIPGWRIDRKCFICSEKTITIEIQVEEHGLISICPSCAKAYGLETLQP